MEESQVEDTAKGLFPIKPGGSRLLRGAKQFMAKKKKTHKTKTINYYKKFKAIYLLSSFSKYFLL